LNIPAILVAGYPTFKAGIKSLLKSTLNVHVLIAIAAVFVLQKSIHPLAKAISKYYKESSVKVEEVEEPDKFLEFEGGGPASLLT